MKEKNIRCFIREHKKAFFLTGAAVIAFAGAAFLITRSDSIKVLLSNRTNELCAKPVNVVCTKQSVVSKINIDPMHPSEIKVISIPGHLRNLPTGHHPSASKIAEAAEKGISLANSQTLISPYSKRCAA